MTARSRSRSDLIADTALALLAERGMRGLTHRAVDEAAGLPPGSTSNHARTRSALLSAAVGRLAAHDADVVAAGEAPKPGSGVDGLAAMLAIALYRASTTGRDLARARFEIALEATRRPELRAVYEAAGHGFRVMLAELLAQAGAADPERQSRSLVAWCDGVLFSSVAGAHATEPPELDHLRAGAEELLRGMVDGDGRRVPGRPSR